MKRHIKTIVIAGGAVAIAVLATFAAIQTKCMLEYARFRCAPTGPVRDDILAIKDTMVNLYLVKTTTGWIALDSGMNSGNVERQARKLGVDPAQVRAVFLTHSDFDHSGGLKAFPAATRYLCDKEEPLATGAIRRTTIGRNRVPGPIEYLPDGSETTVDGRTVRCVWVPGHTPGSAAYLVDGAYLFTGDEIGIRDGKIGQFNEFFNMDTPTAVRSIDRLTAIRDVKLILTGHYGAHDADAGRQP